MLPILLLRSPSYGSLPRTLGKMVSPSLIVVTLIYGQSSEHVKIAHNCRLISRTRHRFIIYTDDMSQRYCDVCECRRFVKKMCKCPDKKTGCRVKNPCEKLFFLIDRIREFHEFVFLDNDLIILKKYFLDRLQARSQAHDFLATYGHAGIDSSRYLRNFNSGLFFIRHLPNLDYDKMKRMMYDQSTEKDQGIVSNFVQKNYENWDVLSWKWHCRMLSLMNQDIPHSACYTLHDRREYVDILKNLNMTLLKIP